MAGVKTQRRSGWMLLLAALLAACAGSVGLTAPSGAPPARSIELVTRGGNVACSTALRKIAFSRFDPRVIGGPDMSGHRDGTGTFQLFVAEPDGSRGLGNADIAEALHLSEGTVRNHVSAVLAKLNVADRTQAAILALRSGLAGVHWPR